MQATRYAGFWLRFVAAVVDGLLTGAVGFLVAAYIGSAVGMLGVAIGTDPQVTGAAAQLSGFLFQTAGTWLYFSLMESSAKQATLGKMMIGLVVTDMDGQRITFGRATGRYFAKFLSTATLMIGYIMAGITGKKQALHDLIARTLVWRGNPAMSRVRAPEEPGPIPVPPESGDRRAA